MKKIGILGGIGPESTVDYYRRIVAEYRRRQPDGSYPSFLINSIDMKRMLDLIGAGELNEVADFLLGEISALAGAGAEVGALASNTPHLVFDALRRRSPIPLVSIVEAARDEAEGLGLGRVGLFGTRFTMQGRFYPDVFAKAGITVVTPQPDEQDFIHDKYMTEWVNGIFLPETAEAALRIAFGMRERQRIQGLILGGTELPLALRGSEDPGIPMLDTTRIHVDRLVAEMLAS
jgi:aspartate racemase